MPKRPLEITDVLVIPAAELEYEYARSSGPGGQHVNTTDTRVRLRFDLAATAALPEDVKARLRAQNPAWLTDEGVLVLTSDANRSRRRNLDEVRERLAAAVRAALVRPKKRRATKPSRGAQQRRLSEKKRRGDVKSGRKRPKLED